MSQDLEQVPGSSWAYGWYCKQNTGAGILAFTQVVLLAAAAATAQQVPLQAMGEAKCSALQKSDENVR